VGWVKFRKPFRRGKKGEGPRRETKKKATANSRQENHISSIRGGRENGAVKGPSPVRTDRPDFFFKLHQERGGREGRPKTRTRHHHGEEIPRSTMEGLRGEFSKRKLQGR